MHGFMAANILVIFRKCKLICNNIAFYYIYIYIVIYITFYCPQIWRQKE